MDQVGQGIKLAKVHVFGGNSGVGGKPKSYSGKLKRTLRKPKQIIKRSAVQGLTLGHSNGWLSLTRG